MRVRVLGSHGGESPSHRPSSFLVDDKLLLDSGAATRSLSLGEQARVDWVLVTHSHLDHVKGLPLLLDNVAGKRERPVELITSPGTADVLERHLFNGLLWPDFTRLPTPEAPILRTRRLRPGETLELDGLALRIVPVHHPVEAHGAIVSDGKAALAYSGDTGPTDDFWRLAGEEPRLRAIICDVSFPNELEGLARLSGHLTPALLAAELEKLPAEVSVPVLATHVKPAFAEQVKTQLERLDDPRVRMLLALEELSL